MASYVTKSGRVRETAHVSFRPWRDGREVSKGVYRQGRFVPNTTKGVTANTYDKPKGQRYVVLCEAPFEHITAFQIAKAAITKLPSGEWRNVWKPRGGCIWGR